MTPTDWLEEHAPGFHELTRDDREAIMLFVFLWSFFEFEVLNTQGNVKALVRVTEEWVNAGLPVEQSLHPHVTYLQERYCPDGTFSYHFDHLNLRPSDEPDLVRKVLKNDDVRPAEIAAAALIVIYRLRNNLFHGEKWSYALRDQLLNFSHANAVLAHAIALHRQWSRG